MRLRTSRPYLYASFVKERLGVHPAKLVLNLFREQELLEETFDEAAFSAAIEWATDTVTDILAEEAWQPCRLDYFCRFICSVAYHCPVYLEQEGG